MVHGVPWTLPMLVGSVHGNISIASDDDGLNLIQNGTYTRLCGSVPSVYIIYGSEGGGGGLLSPYYSVY